MKLAGRLRERRVSLQTLLIALFVIQIAAVGGTTAWLSLRHGQRSVDELARELLGEVAARIDQSVVAYLVVPQLLNGLNSATYGLLGLDVGDAARLDAASQRLERYMWRQLRLYPQVSYVAIANEHGDCVSVIRGQAAGPAFYAETRSLTSHGLLARYALSGDGRRARLLGRSRYDPRVRPWYRAARGVGGAAWSPVYALHGRPELGLTAAYPIHGSSGKLAGVLAADIELSYLSQFMRGLRIGKSGKAFVVERNGLLVAAPSLEPLLQGTTRLAAMDSTDPLVRGAARAVADRFGDFRGFADIRRLTYSDAGQANLVQVTPVALAGHPGLDWLSVVVVHEEDFMGHIRANTAWTVGLCVLAVFAAAALGVLLTRRLTRPLLALSAEMTHIANLELDTDIAHGPSRVAEIHEIQTDLAAMKAGLRSFEKYVSVDVVRRLMRTQREAILGVETANVTVFFSDIADFTTISESLPLDVLVDLVGEYLGEMSNVIVYSGGTLDKYIGDAIMAFWNAPEPVAHHPEVACEVALRCMERLHILHRAWESRGLPLLRCRVGLHTGPVLVGNLGSARRMDYTVIGDTVNLASRLEGLNKRYGTQILISDELYAAVRDSFLCRLIDLVAVKGRARPTRIYELLARSAAAMPGQVTLVERYEQAFECYLRQDFPAAAAALQRLIEDFPADAPARELLGRCQAYQADPPARDWDGVLVLHEK